MAKQESNYISDPDALASKLKEIVRDIHEEISPHEMNAYKRFFKRNVSIFSRAYFNAYLVRQLDKGGERPKRPPKPAQDAVPDGAGRTVSGPSGESRRRAGHR